MTKAEKDKVYNTKGLAPNISMPVKGNASSRTTSAIAEGTIDIRENPTQDISELSRDTENALNELGRIFDKKKIEEQQELVRVFREEAYRLAHNLKDDGSGRKVLIHALIGGLMSQLSGAGFSSGAAGAGLNEALINNLKGLDPALAQIISGIIGAAAAKAAGGNAAAGASAAAAGTKWNYLLEWQYRRMREELSKAATEEEKKAILERWEEIDNAQEDRMREDMRKDEYIIYSTDSEEVTQQKRAKFAVLYGDLHYSLTGETAYILPDTVVIGHKNMTFKEFAAVAHEGLDLAGYVPGFGSAAGAAETVLYLAEGDYESAGSSAIGIIPFVKVIKKAKKFLAPFKEIENKAPAHLPEGKPASSSIPLEDLGRIKPGSKDIYMPDGKSLRPNIQYKAGEFEYLYKTDEAGRLSQFKTDNLQLTERDKRLRHNPNTPGKQEGDQAAHLAADRFGGSPELANLVSQSSHVNLSEYKKLENEWAKAIKEGKNVQVEVNVIYEGTSKRPSEFVVSHTIDGKPTTTIIAN